MLRVRFSKVRMPRSHSMTLGFPLLMMYSALMSSSSMVPAMPRLSSTGLPAMPTSLSRLKFWVLRAPICRTSMSMSTNSCTSRTSMISVTMGMPVSSRAAQSSSRPALPMPWLA